LANGGQILGNLMDAGGKKSGGKRKKTSQDKIGKGARDWGAFPLPREAPGVEGKRPGY